MSYLVTDGKGNYVHFEPRTKAYFLLKEQKGAAVFDELNAKGVANEFGLKSVKLNPSILVSKSNKTEGEYFDELH